MKALLVNDTHIAANRRSGTTPDSAQQLRARTLRNFQDLLMAHTDKDVIHAGDILDDFDVPNADMVGLYNVLSQWLQASGRKFVALRANHDWHPSATRLSSWDLLFNILHAQYPDQVVLVLDKLTRIQDNVYGLGHVGNQDLFDLQLEAAMALENAVLIAHANFDNDFVADSDHSLLITRKWAEAFVARGNRLYCGHEHQKSSHFDGKVVMLGSQDATSIADCLGNEAKFAHILDDDASLTPIQTMEVSKEFIRVDWTDLGTVGDQPFVRIEGHAKASQAADVVSAIARYRSKSDALVIANAVKVEGVNNIEGFGGVSLDDIQRFNVRDALMEMFTEEERKVLEGCLED